MTSWNPAKSNWKYFQIEDQKKMSDLKNGFVPCHPFHHHLNPHPLDEKTCQGVGVVERWHGTKPFFCFDPFFLNSIWKYFQFDFARFQDVIWKLFSQEFQNRAYFLTYVIFQFSKSTKSSPKLSTYRSPCIYIRPFKI